MLLRRWDGVSQANGWGGWMILGILFCRELISMIMAAGSHGGMYFCLFCSCVSGYWDMYTKSARIFWWALGNLRFFFLCSLCSPRWVNHNLFHWYSLSLCTFDLSLVGYFPAPYAMLCSSGLEWRGKTLSEAGHLENDTTHDGLLPDDMI